jgi:hypothetical protein
VSSPSPQTPTGPSPFARILKALGSELDGGEKATSKALRAASAGRDPSPAELIALQSQIYRYTEVVDLAAKLVDRAANGVKTVVQGQ